MKVINRLGPIRSYYKIHHTLMRFQAYDCEPYPSLLSDTDGKSKKPLSKLSRGWGSSTHSLTYRFLNPSINPPLLYTFTPLSSPSPSFPHTLQPSISDALGPLVIDPWATIHLYIRCSIFFLEDFKSRAFNNHTISNFLTICKTRTQSPWALRYFGESSYPPVQKPIY